MSNKIEFREKQYCIGCGLCKSHFGENKAKLYINDLGFFEPMFDLSEKEHIELTKFCPIDVPPSSYSKKVWGEYKKIALGYATDEGIRWKASSGGAITAICGCLLTQGMVDGVIQLGDGDTPLKKESKLSRDLESVLKCSGSRYIASLPLENIIQVLKDNPEQKFALVGRPCDIKAMRAYLQIDPSIQHQVICLLSFFCAGTPSINASRQMIKAMGSDEQKVTHVSYRGNGWPGYSTVIEKDGTEYTMDYENSWGKILGRDIYRGCRLCYDGIGEEADISCGDAWYLDENGNVSFDERPGRNVIFARTDIGLKILEQARERRWIACEAFDINLLSKMQPFQYVRKAQLYYKLLAIRSLRKKIPNLRISELAYYKNLLSTKKKFRMYLGTLRRIAQKKL